MGPQEREAWLTSVAAQVDQHGPFIPYLIQPGPERAAARLLHLNDGSGRAQTRMVRDAWTTPVLRPFGMTRSARVKGQPWQFAYREALSPYVFARVLIVIGLYMGAYVAICPLGTNDLPWIQRLAYFTLGSSLVAPLCYSEYAITLYLVRFWTPGFIAAAVVAHVFVATSTATAIAYGIDSLFLSELPAYGFTTVYVFMTLSVALCSAVVHYLVSQRVKNEAGGSTAAELEPPAPAAGDAPAPAARGHVASTTSSKFLHRLPSRGGPGHHMAQDERSLRGRLHHLGSMRRPDPVRRCHRRAWRHRGARPSLPLGCLVPRRRLGKTQPTAAAAAHRRASGPGKPHLPR